MDCDILISLYFTLDDKRGESSQYSLQKISRSIWTLDDF